MVGPAGGYQRRSAASESDDGDDVAPSSARAVGSRMSTKAAREIRLYESSSRSSVWSQPPAKSVRRHAPTSQSGAHCAADGAPNAAWLVPASRWWCGSSAAPKPYPRSAVYSRSAAPAPVRMCACRAVHPSHAAAPPSGGLARSVDGLTDGLPPP